MKRLVLLSVVLLAGCATSGQTDLLDFNTRFKESIPTNPLYKIENAGRDKYQIIVYQGAALISERTTRAAHLTRAALIAMDAHCAERAGKLSEHTVRDDADSFGFVNVLGFFSCKTVT